MSLQNRKLHQQLTTSIQFWRSWELWCRIKLFDVDCVQLDWRQGYLGKKPFLNATHRKKRLAQWAKEHLTWTAEDWERVIWSDETRISIFGSDGVRYVRRRQGEDCLPECMQATMKHPLSVMVWGCRTPCGVERIQVLSGNVNASKYISEVLETKMLPSARDLFGTDNYLFQQHGAPCHTARVCMQCLLGIMSNYCHGQETVRT